MILFTPIYVIGVFVLGGLYGLLKGDPFFEQGVFINGLLAGPFIFVGLFFGARMRRARQSGRNSAE